MASMHTATWSCAGASKEHCSDADNSHPYVHIDLRLCRALLRRATVSWHPHNRPFNVLLHEQVVTKYCYCFHQLTSHDVEGFEMTNRSWTSKQMLSGCPLFSSTQSSTGISGFEKHQSSRVHSFKSPAMCRCEVVGVCTTKQTCVCSLGVAS